MKNISNKAFTLVELLVVITILAIISVVAYQNFGGAVDKANAGRKIGDVATIESSLMQYKADKNYYPKVGEQSATNLWGYTGSTTASKSNLIRVTYDGDSIASVVASNGGGTISGSGSLGQIGAKGTVGKEQLGKYLSKDLYDPEVGDIKVGASENMIDQGIGRYVYGIYKKSFNWASNNQEGQYYNIAFTLKQEGEEWYITKIVWDYDKSNFSNPDDYPETLIGSDPSNVLLNESVQNAASNSSDYGIPYAVTDFAQ